eukprot:GHVT01066191.1.p1 GENE.GHVT01066191.1~~GHVT01066191.1.p1  ORF type:complete len:131 (+),score=19.08 GHVT01066191.1:292-684(+)
MRPTASSPSARSLSGLSDDLLSSQLCSSFGSLEAFKEKFSNAALGHFGSGWTWLVYSPKEGKLKVVQTHDAVNPMAVGTDIPLLTCDVWEHAYYIDYRNDRPKYIKGWWDVVNWNFVDANLHMAMDGKNQ